MSKNIEWQMAQVVMDIFHKRKDADGDTVMHNQLNYEVRTLVEYRGGYVPPLLNLVNDPGGNQLDLVKIIDAVVNAEHHATSWVFHSRVRKCWLKVASISVRLLMIYYEFEEVRAEQLAESSRLACWGYEMNLDNPKNLDQIIQNLADREASRKWFMEYGRGANK